MRIVIGFICLVLTVFFILRFLGSNKNSEFCENAIAYNWANTDALANVRAKVLLTSRFKDLDDLKKVVKITYDKDYSQLDSADYGQSTVTLIYLSNGELIKRSMSSGVSQIDVVKAYESNYFGKAGFALTNPFPMRLRKELSKVNLIARRRPLIFGLGDVAFYDLAEALVEHINTPELSFRQKGDYTERGFVNTFNHVTAQAIITSFFSEDLADFISDLHERKSMPELTNGVFNKYQLMDSINNPLDNYVDIANNEIGQEIGLLLKTKYGINENTICTPVLLTSYMNDLQSYYGWALNIGLDKFYSKDEEIINFTSKLNCIMHQK